ISLLFDVGIYDFMGPGPALEFLTGYLIEKSLSVDNIFVFVLIFSYFGVPARYQHRVLFWGIIGALLMRGTMISAGAYLIHRRHLIMYAVGAFLVVRGIRRGVHHQHLIDPAPKPVLRLILRIVRVSPRGRGQRFYVREVHSARMG